VPLIRFRTGATFDPASGEVGRGDDVTRLEPQPAALLALLAARPGELVSHAEIAGSVWPDGTHVDFQGGVHYAIRRIRAALGESAREPGLIETMPRRGYRLRADAVIPPVLPAEATGAERPPPSRRGRRAGAALVVAAALGAAVAVVERRPNDHHARAVALMRAVHDLIY
jgi:DNA-binding winged helix-turn-helix (wHTH) protein